ncbi:MAG: hypothetical protein QXK06_02830 [Candidatus Diapherotrites archaeon]
MPAKPKNTRKKLMPVVFQQKGLKGKKGVSGGWTPTELAATREMLSTWIGLLNYPPTEKERFLSWFDRAAKKGEPINLAKYLEKLEKAPLEEGKKQAEIKFYEGHTPPEFYHEAMKKAGLISQKTMPYTVYSTQSPLLYQMMVKKNA